MLEKHETVALERRIIECAVPLFTTQTANGEPALLGTSTLVELNGTLMLVTAKHLFEDLDCTTLAFPTSPLKSDIWTLGSIERIEPREENLDVSVLVIQSEETAKILRAGWRPASLNSVAVPARFGRFVLSGFPAALTAETPGYLQGKMLSIYTDRLQETPPNAQAPVIPFVDLFFLCDDSSETLDGKPQKLPRLQGTSGAGVWEVVEAFDGGIWTTERALRLIGIQSTYRPEQYFRAKSWSLVAQVLQKSEVPALTAAGNDLASRLELGNAGDGSDSAA